MRQQPTFGDGLYWGISAGAFAAIVLSNLPRALLIYIGFLAGAGAALIVVVSLRRTRQRLQRSAPVIHSVLLPPSHNRGRRWWR